MGHIWRKLIDFPDLRGGWEHTDCESILWNRNKRNPSCCIYQYFVSSSCLFFYCERKQTIEDPSEAFPGCFQLCCYKCYGFGEHIIFPDLPRQVPTPVKLVGKSTSSTTFGVMEDPLPWLVKDFPQHFSSASNIHSGSQCFHFPATFPNDTHKKVIMGITL